MHNQIIRLALTTLIAAASVATTFSAAAESIMRMGMSSLPLSFANPFRSGATPTIYFTTAIFDGLTRIDKNGSLHPWLAVSWEAIDEKTWRVQLRQNVTFSNGTPFSAEAAAFAINYLASEDSLQESLRRELPVFERAVVVDSHTVDITTKDSDPLLMRSLTILPMVEPEQWQRLGRDGFAREPIGTGPFQIESWGAADAKMAAVPTSWRAPKIDGLHIRAIPDKSARIQALQSGQIDLAIEFGPEDGPTIEAAGLNLERWIAAETSGLSFILHERPNSPLQDVRVREALNLAVNRDALTNILLEGATVPANQPAPRAALGHNPDLPPIPFDRDRARALLKEAGQQDGLTLVAQVVSGIGVGESALQVIANDFAAIGVKLEIRSIPIQQFLRSLGRGDWPKDVDAFGMNWPVWPSLDSLRALRLHSCLRREPWYCDETIMPQIRSAMAEWEPDKALGQRQNIMAWYRQQYPAVFVFETAQVAGMRPNVSGFSMTNEIISYETLSFVP